MVNCVSKKESKPFLKSHLLRNLENVSDDFYSIENNKKIENVIKAACKACKTLRRDLAKCLIWSFAVGEKVTE